MYLDSSQPGIYSIKYGSDVAGLVLGVYKLMYSVGYGHFQKFRLEARASDRILSYWRIVVLRLANVRRSSNSALVFMLYSTRVSVSHFHS